ncbi:MAG: hypothetical protein ACTSWQ_03630, partial [Candidatus Thorarchaeota archaeon]
EDMVSRIRCEVVYFNPFLEGDLSPLVDVQEQNDSMEKEIFNSIIKRRMFMAKMFKKRLDKLAQETYMPTSAFLTIVCRDFQGFRDGIFYEDQPLFDILNEAYVMIRLRADSVAQKKVELEQTLRGIVTYVEKNQEYPFRSVYASWYPKV